MKEFMNVPGLIQVTERNIIEEYRRYPDVKHVAKVFDIPAKEVRRILKQAGIKIEKPKEKEYSELEENGLRERDFYHDGN